MLRARESEVAEARGRIRTPLESFRIIVGQVRPLKNLVGNQVTVAMVTIIKSLK